MLSSEMQTFLPSRFLIPVALIVLTNCRLGDLYKRRRLDKHAQDGPPDNNCDQKKQDEEDGRVMVGVPILYEQRKYVAKELGIDPRLIMGNMQDFVFRDSYPEKIGTTGGDNDAASLLSGSSLKRKKRGIIWNKIQRVKKGIQRVQKQIVSVGARIRKLIKGSDQSTEKPKYATTAGDGGPKYKGGNSNNGGDSGWGSDSGGNSGATGWGQGGNSPGGYASGGSSSEGQGYAGATQGGYSANSGGYSNIDGGYGGGNSQSGYSTGGNQASYGPPPTSAPQGGYSNGPNQPTQGGYNSGPNPPVQGGYSSETTPAPQGGYSNQGGYSSVENKGAYGPPSPTQSYGPPSPTQSYGPPSPTQSYGPPSPTQSYGPPSPTQSYGSPSPTQSYGPASPTQSYGPQSPSQSYGPASPTQSYGSPSPTQSYGPASPTQSYGPQSPSQSYGPASPTQSYGPPQTPPSQAGGYSGGYNNGGYPGSGQPHSRSATSHSAGARGDTDGDSMRESDSQPSSSNINPSGSYSSWVRSPAPHHQSSSPTSSFANSYTRTNPTSSKPKVSAVRSSRELEMISQRFDTKSFLSSLLKKRSDSPPDTPEEKIPDILIS